MTAPQGGLSAADIAAIYALVQAQAAVRDQMVRTAVAAAVAPWRLLNWFDNAAVLLAALDIVRVVQPAQRRMAQLTDAYLTRMLGVQLGRPVRPAGAVDVSRLRRLVTPDMAEVLDRPARLIEPEDEDDLDDVFDDDDDDLDDLDDLDALADDIDDLWRFYDDLDELDRQVDRVVSGPGRVVESPPLDVVDDREVPAVDPVEPYRRVAAQYRYHVTTGGLDAAEAFDQAVERAAIVAETDIVLAERAQARETFRQVDPEEVIGYRRILRPYLGSGGPPCGLCVVASNRRYYIQQLRPIHERCRCGVMPITRLNDPGLQLNAEDLQTLYGAAGGTTAGASLKRVRVAVSEHGELGPVLVRAPKTSSKRRGPRAASASRSTFRRLTPQERLPGLERELEAYRARVAAGESLHRAVAHVERIIAEVRRELAGS